MNIFLTYDYELFFGKNIGTAEKCVLDPTRKLMHLAEKYNAKFTFFVDVLYLMKLEEYTHVEELKEELLAIKNQLNDLIQSGHDIQLHLHTHWLYSTYNGSWKLDYPNYRVHNFSSDKIEWIVTTSVNYLEELIQKKIFAFRAGGWCLQPFETLKDSFLKNGISLDSTVFHGGYSTSSTNLYDFKESPDLDEWKFDTDPLIINLNGAFTELPISSYIVSPLFFWKATLLQKIFPKTYCSAGNGKGISKSLAQIIRYLFFPTSIAVSCDGYKSSLLERAFKAYIKKGRNNFVIIGHPKLLSDYAFAKLDKFMSGLTKNNCSFKSISEVFGVPEYNSC